MFTLYQWISIIGVPSIMTMVVWSVKQIMNIRKENKQRASETEKKIDMLMSAHQIQLRDNLMSKYKKFMKLGCITAEDMELWESIYQNYHGLGQNGIMDKRREQILELPVVDEYK